MEVIDITYWAVTEPDGGGMHEITIANFTTKKAADAYKEHLQGKNAFWPKSVSQRNISLTLYDSCEEKIKAEDERIEIARQIEALQKKLDRL